MAAAARRSSKSTAKPKNPATRNHAGEASLKQSNAIITKKQYLN